MPFDLASAYAAQDRVSQALAGVQKDHDAIATPAQTGLADAQPG
jgi:hypothetical protein